MADHGNRDGPGPQPQELKAAVEGLRAALQQPLDANDLGRLAQMHTGCQTLSALGGEVGGLADAVASLLEGIILKEAADTEAGLALIPEAIRVLGNALLGRSVKLASLLAQVRAATTGQATDAGGIAHVGGPLVIDLNEREHLEDFVDESREHLDAIEVALLEVEKDPTDTARINELFRPFHTIKGIAGFLNLRDINRLTHEMETILDLGRRSELAVTTDTIDLFFAGLDVLKQQISELANYLASPHAGPVPQPNISDIVARLHAVASGEALASAAAPEAPAGTADVPRATQPARSVVDGGGSSPAEGGSVQTAETSIRIDTAKLDFLVDAVGEMVIAQSVVNLNSVVATDEKLSRDVAQVTKLVRDVQETAMAMRMVPIGRTFRKMRRLARDVSRKAGKLVELRISGEETELDKNVIQAIADPLVHMVRNAVDHGIERPDARRAAGKPEVGTVHLNAFHRGDRIVIEVSDDGRGLDREKIIARGIERGLVSPGDQLSDQQAFSLIVQPGFSTAEEITDISGRGVGLDVVRRNVERLRGKIEISSEPGRGSVFSVRLPLTLAIIDGMLVRVGHERLIIPTVLIEQSLRPERHQMTQVHGKGTMIQVRGELIALVQLGSLFGFSGPVDPTEGLVVIAHAEAQKIGIVVDQLIGQRQVVIKTLGERFKRVRGVSGAAVLGDGHVGLILEPTGLLAFHNSNQAPGAGERGLLGATAGCDEPKPLAGAGSAQP